MMEAEFTPKMRLKAAAHKDLVDRPPCICPGGMMNMMVAEIMEQSGCYWPRAHMDADMMAGLTYAQNQAGGFENYGVPFCMTVEAEAMGAVVNLGNRILEPHVTDPLLTSCAQREKLQPFDLQTGRVKTVLEAIAILKENKMGVPVIGNLTGPVTLAGTLLDLSVLLKEFRKSPEYAHRYMKIICDNLIAFGQAQIEAGADAVCISEPSGTGEILGPKLFTEYTVTYPNQILDALLVPVKIVYICGDLKKVYNFLPQIHCDVFSFDAIVPVKEIKQHLTQAVMGNISTFALGSVSCEKIGRLVSAAIEDGVEIVAPACGLPTTTPLANIQAMVKAVQTKDEQR